jgi:anti-sigma B factor antagonist
MVPPPTTGTLTVDRTNGSSATVTGSMDDPQSPVILIQGELDLASVESVRAGIEPFLAPGPSQVTFNLEKLTFMDSSGIALLVQSANRVGKVELTNVSPIVRRVLEVTGLLELFGLAR